MSDELDMSVEDLPLVSFRGLRRSSWVIAGLGRLYLGLYDVPADRVLEFFPVIGFIEALVYQCDADVELAGGLTPAVVATAKRRHASIVLLLRKLALEDKRAEAEMVNMWIYAALEGALNKPDAEVTLAQLRRAAELRTSDVRVLHAIIARLAGREADERYCSVLWPLEVIGDIEQDLESYADDVAHDHYNTYAMFERLFGDAAPERMAAEIAGYQAMYEQRLAELEPGEQLRIRNFVAGHRARTPAPPIPGVGRGSDTSLAA